MGIQRLQPVSGGTDWSKYTNPIHTGIQTGGAFTQNVYTNVLNVTGEGFLDYAWIKTINSAQDFILKITIDGVVIFEAVNLSYAATGFVNIERLVWNGASPSVPYQTYVSTGSSGGLSSETILNSNTNTLLSVNYPYVNPSNVSYDGIACFINSPIFFKSSVSIDIKKTTSTTDNCRLIVGGMTK